GTGGDARAVRVGALPAPRRRGEAAPRPAPGARPDAPAPLRAARAASVGVRHAAQARAGGLDTRGGRYRAGRLRAAGRTARRGARPRRGVPLRPNIRWPLLFLGGALISAFTIRQGIDPFDEGIALAA